MSKGKIIGVVVAVVILVGGGVGAGIFLSKDKDVPNNKDVNTSTTGENTAETQTPAKTPAPLPIEYSGTGDYESEIFTLANGSLSLSANIGVDKASIDSGSGGYSYIGVRLINVDGKDFPGVDEYNSGKGGTLSVGKTINKSDGQSSYTMTERINVVAGDYKLEIKGGPSGLGPRLTNWTVKLY